MVGGRYRGRKSKDLAQISSLLDEMKNEWALQKQSLEQKIEALEQELSQARQLAQTALAQHQVEDRPTSRRRMLKRLGAAAAGLAVAGVAAGVSSPQTAEAAAANLQGNITLPADAGPDGTINTVVGTTTIQNNNSNTGAVLQVKNQFSTVTGGTTGNPYPNDALVAVSTVGLAVNANTLSGSGTPAIQGVQATDPSSLLTSLGAQVTGAGAGVQGVGNTANGVSGVSSQGIGVYGFSSGNYGVVCQIGGPSGGTPTGLAPLLIVPAGPTAGGAPTTGSHATGEIYVDGSTPANIWFCNNGGSFGPISAREVQQRHPNASAADRQRMVSGAAPQFVKLSGGSGGGGTADGNVQYLPNPLRLVGAGNDLFSTLPSIPGVNAQGAFQPVYYPIAGFTVNNTNLRTGAKYSGIIPSTAKGVLGTLTVVNAVANGYIIVFPGNLNSSQVPFVASINYPPATTLFALSNAVSVALGTISSGQFAGQLGVGFASLQPCQIGFDVLAYTT